MAIVRASIRRGRAATSRGPLALWRSRAPCDSASATRRAAGESLQPAQGFALDPSLRSVALAAGEHVVHLLLEVRPRASRRAKRTSHPCLWWPIPGRVRLRPACGGPGGTPGELGHVPRGSHCSICAPLVSTSPAELTSSGRGTNSVVRSPTSCRGPRGGGLRDDATVVLGGRHACNRRRR